VRSFCAHFPAAASALSELGGFAARHGIKYTTFVGWIPQRRKVGKACSGLAAAMKFVASIE
jgi:hypothetical protein